MLQWRILMGDHLAISRGPFTGPLNPLKTDVSRGRQVFQVGQAPSGPTVIRPRTAETQSVMIIFWPISSAGVRLHLGFSLWYGRNGVVTHELCINSVLTNGKLSEQFGKRGYGSSNNGGGLGLCYDIRNWQHELSCGQSWREVVRGEREETGACLAQYLK